MTTKLKTVEIRVLVTVTVEHEALSVRDQKRAALSCIWRNSTCSTCGGKYYDAVVKNVKVMPGRPLPEQPQE